MSFFLELLFLFKTQVGETKKRLTDVANEGKQLVQPVPHNTLIHRTTPEERSLFAHLLALAA